MFYFSSSFPKEFYMKYFFETYQEMPILTFSKAFFDFGVGKSDFPKCPAIFEDLNSAKLVSRKIYYFQSVHYYVSVMVRPPCI